MRLSFCLTIFVCVILTISVSVSSGYELKTQYATVVYEKEEQLRTFNREVSLGSLSYLLRNRKSITVEDEVRNKLDVIIDKVQTILDMYPGGLNFRIILLSTDAEVRKAYRDRYGSSVDYIAFYAPRDKTVFISVADIRLGVLAHELAHVVINHYFLNSPPRKINEVLAQFVETHLKD
jgi:hypothetical protein